jgi:hypothetical protein
MIAQAVGFGALIPLYFGLGMVSMSGGILFLLALWLFGTSLMALIIIGPPVHRALGVGIVLDEAGARLRLRRTRSYWPFALLSGASVEKRKLATPRLVLSDRTGRAVVDVPLLNDAARASADRIVSELGARVAESQRSPEAVPAGLERDGRALDEWCAELDRIARLPDDGEYRERTLDRRALLELGGEPGASVEVRAAALYVLLKSDEAEHRAAALAILGEASAPLVLALAERAVPSLPLTATAVDGAREYLEREDLTGKS